jgi:hypothetical protein
VLLRTGGVAAAVVGVIWALTAWVGQPSSSSSCPGGAGCEAKAPATSPAVSVQPGDLEAADEPEDEAPTAAPEATEALTASPRATTPTVHRPRTAAPTIKATVTRRPTPRTATITATSPATVSTEEPREPASQSRPEPTSQQPTSQQPTSKPTESASQQPTTAPAPNQDPPKHGNGLFGWLF